MTRGLAICLFLAGPGLADDAEFTVAPDLLALEGDAAYGEYLAGECAACHQATGGDDGIPSITGWATDRFVTTLHAYREGAREHPVMQMVAGRLGDAEIAALAAWFAMQDASEH